jgi:hypothetical protein
MWDTLPLELAWMIRDELEPGEARQAAAVLRRFRDFFAPRGSGSTFGFSYSLQGRNTLTLAEPD